MLTSNFSDSPEFSTLKKISKSTPEGEVILKYFDRSKVNLQIDAKKIYEINEVHTKFKNLNFENVRRMLLWYSINDREANSLSKILANGINGSNGGMGHGFYFRDRINKFFKYENNDFGLLLLCDVAVGSM